MPAQVQDLGAPIITNYEPEQFKAHIQNWVAVQDHRGVMYFGNSSGILEFDGQRWQLIPTRKCHHPGPDLRAGRDDLLRLHRRFRLPGRIPFRKGFRGFPEGGDSRASGYSMMSGRSRAAADGIYFLSREQDLPLDSGRMHPVAGQVRLVPGLRAEWDRLLRGHGKRRLHAGRGPGRCPFPSLAGVYNGKRITLAPFGRHELLVGRVTGDFLRIDLSALWDETAQRYDITRPGPQGHGPGRSPVSWMHS